MTTRSQKVEVKKDEAGRESRPLAHPAAYSPLGSLREELDRVLERFYPEGWHRWPRLADFEPLRGIAMGDMLLSPKADMSETDSEYEVSVELPGLEEKDIELGVSDGMLTLKGEKKEEREEKKKDYHLTERRYGSVRRIFRLPEGVDADKIKAAFSKGVLKVTLPKTKEAKARQRRIPVKAA